MSILNVAYGGGASAIPGQTPAFNPIANRAPTPHALAVAASGVNDFYGPNKLDLSGNLPKVQTDIGAGLQAVRDPSLQGLLDYYTKINNVTPQGAGLGQNLQFSGEDPYNYHTLNNYLEGTYWKQGNVIPGTDIGHSRALQDELLGPITNGALDYSRLTGDNLLDVLGPNAAQILADARDWEVRDVVKGNASTLMDNVGGLLGAAAVGGILAPAVLTGGAAAAGGGFVNPGGLGLSPANLYNPAALGGTVAPSSGLGLTGANLFNPAALGGSLGTGGVTGLGGGAYVPGGGFVNPNGLGVTPTDLYNPVSLGGTPPTGLDINLPDNTPTPDSTDPTPDDPGTIDFPQLPDITQNPTGGDPTPDDPQTPDLPFVIPPIPPGGINDTEQPNDDPPLVVVPTTPSTNNTNNSNTPDIPTTTSPMNLAYSSTSPYQAQYLGAAAPRPADLMTYFSRFMDIEQPEELLSLNPLEWVNPYA